MPTSYQTTNQAAAVLGWPEWRVRRAVDSLGVEVPRAGRYRLISPEVLELIRESEHQRRSAEAAISP